MKTTLNTIVTRYLGKKDGFKQKVKTITIDDGNDIVTFKLMGVRSMLRLLNDGGFVRSDDGKDLSVEDIAKRLVYVRECHRQLHPDLKEWSYAEALLMTECYNNKFETEDCLYWNYDAENLYVKF